MKLLRVLIASVFALSSVTVHAESTTKPEAAPVATTELTAEQKKEFKKYLRQVVKELNSASNLKGFIKNNSDKLTPDLSQGLKDLFTEFGVKETDNFAKCSTKNMSVMCGKQTIEFVSADTVKLNGKVEYKFEKDVTFYKVVKDLIMKSRSEDGNRSGFLGVFLPEAHAIFDGSWGGYLIAALAGGFLLPKIFPSIFGEKVVEKKEVHYFHHTPSEPVVTTPPVDYSIKKATKAKTQEKANK